MKKEPKKLREYLTRPQPGDGEIDIIADAILRNISPYIPKLDLVKAHRIQDAVYCALIRNGVGSCEHPGSS